MAKIEYEGIEEYAKSLGILFKDTEKIIKKAVYEGADIVADELKNAINGLPIQEGENGLSPIGTTENPLTGITRKQKGDLVDGFGLSPMRNESGYIHTKAGMDGYGSIPTSKYQKGVPNAMLMRSIESGTSFRVKNPIFRKTVSRIRKRVEKRMEEVIEKEIKEIMEE